MRAPALPCVGTSCRSPGPTLTQLCGGVNNAINEIKNTLEATNSRITEAEDRISELEDRMVEINESERIKEKRIPGAAREAP